MHFELPELPYHYDALEPFIDAQTMEIHHGKHHQGYVDKLNKALENYPDLREKSVEGLLTDLNSVPDNIRMAVRNNGGGHFNHSLFWKVMAPPARQSSVDKGREPEGELSKELEKEFGSFEELKKQFSNAAATLFGSGWTWLVRDSSNKFLVITTPNQDSPISQGQTPILGLDVWEHAYYLKYQNRRAEYIEAWWNLVNWDQVESNFSS